MKTRRWLLRNAIEFRLKEVMRRLPVLGLLARSVYRVVRGPAPSFSGSAEYWVTRYRLGGNSGPGSYNQLASFKAETINDFVLQHDVGSVIEFGCGDGNQLTLARYPRYLGLDVSAEAISTCKSLFADDASKRFQLLSEYTGETAQLALSLDVIYHLLEEEVFTRHMQSLFDAGERFVIIYSSNVDTKPDSSHVRHRQFSRWVDEHRPDWKLIEHIPNRHPLRDSEVEGSVADFFLYERVPMA